MAKQDSIPPESVRTTDLGTPTKKIRKPTKVRVELIGEPPHHARVTTKPTAPTASDPHPIVADMLLPVSYVSKRMLPGERIAFFRAHVTNTVGDLELDDRLPAGHGW